jgi:hypothetical protein
MACVNPPLASHCPLLFTCHPSFLLPTFLHTWRTSFLARGANTHPPLSLVCYQLPTLCYFSHPNTPHRSSYNIYIDDINNISRPRLTKYDYICKYQYEYEHKYVDNYMDEYIDEST